jgi:hypothetical protein
VPGCSWKGTSKSAGVKNWIHVKKKGYAYFASGLLPMFKKILLVDVLY